MTRPSPPPYILDPTSLDPAIPAWWTVPCAEAGAGHDSLLAALSHGPSYRCVSCHRWHAVPSLAFRIRPLLPEAGNAAEAVPDSTPWEGTSDGEDRLYFLDDSDDTWSVAASPVVQTRFFEGSDGSIVVAAVNAFIATLQPGQILRVGDLVPIPIQRAGDARSSRWLGCTVVFQAWPAPRREASGVEPGLHRAPLRLPGYPAYTPDGHPLQGPEPLAPPSPPAGRPADEEWFPRFVDSDEAGF